MTKDFSSHILLASVDERALINVLQELWNEMDYMYLINKAHT